MKIGILGTGAVGLALGKGWARENHRLYYGSRNPAKQGDDVYSIGKNAECGTLKDAVATSEVVVLAVPYPAVAETVKAIGAAAFGTKTLIDATNPIGRDGTSAAPAGSSAAEELQKLLPQARVVKALNHCFAENMTLGRFGATKLAAFVAGDQTDAKKTAMTLIGDLGFEPLDAGPLRSARNLEAMALLLIHLGYGQKMGTGIGFALARKK